MNTMRKDFTDEERLLIAALTAMCRREARELDEAQEEFERLGDIPTYQRWRMGHRGDLADAHLRVIKARKALEARRDREVLWLNREVAEA
jgi:hypothetical protein